MSGPAIHPLAQIAYGEVGVHEEPRGSNLGPAIRKYKAQTKLDPDDAWPWCAAFVDWCVAQYIKKFPDRVPAKFRAPDTAGAYALADLWAKPAGCVVYSPKDPEAPEVGDIVVYRFSHTGIVAAVAKDRRTFSAVEGNTNNDGSREGYEVAVRARGRSEARNFIRLPSTSTGDPNA